MQLRQRSRPDCAICRRKGSSAFRDTGQAEAVIGLVFDEVLPAYRRHHADLLAH